LSQEVLNTVHKLWPVPLWTHTGIVKLCLNFGNFIWGGFDGGGSTKGAVVTASAKQFG
jgi:hypothetical protein